MTPRLALTGITKRYATTLANDGVDLTVMPGEVHALLGENGAGKSTLVKTIYGIVQPDAGRIQWEGRETAIPNPNAARALGIGMVFQHFSLFESLTVAENIALGLGTKEPMGTLSRRIGEVSRRYGLAVEPDRHVHHLSVGERQRVEIVRCLLQEPKLLIMDEPTSVLTPQEVDDLFVVLRRLSSEGCSVLYISHKLDEIMAICETATVLRAGRVSGHASPQRSSARELAEMMTGSTLPTPRRHGAAQLGTPCLVITKLTLPSDEPFGTNLRDVSLELRAGEVMGIAGVAGNGQKEFLTALSGERRAPNAAAVRLCDQDAGRAGPAARRRMGLAFIPEERLGRGAVGDMSLAENGLLTAWWRDLASGGWLRGGAIRRFAAKVFKQYNVKAAGIGALASSLSGGNMQKFIVGREVEQAPRVLLAAHPTWGVDIGATLSIRQNLLDLAEQGVGVLVVSEDLAELFEICDRIAVLSEGRLSAPLPVAGTSAEQVGLLMGGHHGAHPVAAPIVPELAHAH